MTTHFEDTSFLEPAARYFRFKIALDYITNKVNLSILDLGCGQHIRFYKFIQNKGINLKKYIGIDPLLDDRLLKVYQKNKQIELINSPVNNLIPLADKSVDYIISLAFLEHIDNPGRILTESVRVLKMGGRGIFTTPSLKAQKLLELLDRSNQMTAFVLLCR